MPGDQIILPPIIDRGFTQVRVSPIHGCGLFAKKKIPKGTRILEYEGKRVKRKQIVKDAVKGLTSMIYVMGLDETMVIDGERNGNDSRFINHHCSPNCEVYFINDTPFIYAMQEIKKGEELTFDYHLSLITETPLTTKEKKDWFPCHCGSPVCRGTLIA